MITLLPRLPRPATEGLLDKFLEADPENWDVFNGNVLPEPARFAATGGTKVAPDMLNELRDNLVIIAERNGMGSNRTQAGTSRFDAEAAQYLAEFELLSSGEGLRDDVWAFIGICLAPDVVHWRFSKSRARYLGGIRNTFQRLWVRARSLDRGDSSDSRWGLLESLTEDALVQITERPSLGNQRFVAKELGEAWIRASDRFGKAAMEPLMRSVALRLRILGEIRDLSSLDQSTFSALVDSLFDSASDLTGIS